MLRIFTFIFKKHYDSLPNEARSIKTISVPCCTVVEPSALGCMINGLNPATSGTGGQCIKNAILSSYTHTHTHTYTHTHTHIYIYI
jgi:hypothetical protein